MAGEYICVGMTVRVRPTDGPLADITLVKGQMNDVTNDGYGARNAVIVRVRSLRPKGRSQRLDSCHAGQQD